MRRRDNRGDRPADQLDHPAAKADIGSIAAEMKAIAAKRPHLPRVYDVCQALNSIAKVLKKPASKRMNVATSGNVKDY